MYSTLANVYALTKSDAFSQVGCSITGGWYARCISYAFLAISAAVTMPTKKTFCSRQGIYTCLATMHAGCPKLPYSVSPWKEEYEICTPPLILRRHVLDHDYLLPPIDHAKQEVRNDAPECMGSSKDCVPSPPRQSPKIHGHYPTIQAPPHSSCRYLTHGFRHGSHLTLNCK